jgi:hypothetical protein
MSLQSPLGGSGGASRKCYHQPKSPFLRGLGDAGNTGIRDGDILAEGARAGSTDGGITIEEVAAETARAGSSPALALKAYLEKPNAERLKYLTCAVLVCKGMDPTGWEKHGNAAKAAAFDSHNHPLDWDCEQCL